MNTDIEDDGEEITIEHLLEESCILNDAFNVIPVFDTRKKEIVLISDDNSDFQFEVIEVVGMKRDGSFKLTLRRPNGGISKDQKLIKESLAQRSTKR